jgi:hypothetical protein
LCSAACCTYLVVSCCVLVFIVSFNTPIVDIVQVNSSSQLPVDMLRPA